MFFSDVFSELLLENVAEMKWKKKTERRYTKAILALTNVRMEKSESRKLKIHYNCVGT